jgi:hypothetical protein
MAPMVLVRVDPAVAAGEVDLNGMGADIAFHAYAKVDGKNEVDVTSQVAWAVGEKAIGAIGSDGVLKLAGTGGKTTIGATYQGVSGASMLTVKLKGDVFTGVDPTTKTAFDTAQVDPDMAHAPALEYPEDGVVLPGNLPPIETQWAQGGDSATYRLHLTSPGVLDVTLYQAARELTIAKDLWAKIGATAPDAAIQLQVDGLGLSLLRHDGAPRTMTIARDGIQDSAIYVWQSSSGSFRVLDIVKGTDIPLPSNAGALSAGQPCSGCHRISRDGKRFAYTFNGGNFFLGTLAYDDAQKTYAEKFKPTGTVRGTYATFNPNEGTQIPAMLVTSPDNVPQNTAGTVRLTMVDPDTNAPIANDFAASVMQLDPSIGRATMMPDWSPAGDFVVYTAFDSDKHFVRLLGDDTVLGSIIEAPVSYQNGNFHFGPPKVLVQAPAGADPDSGQNNVLPSISPDGSVVAFTRADGWWSIKTQQSLINLSGRIAIVRRSDKQVIELERGAPNGPNHVWSSTWPQWAPSVGNKYVWLAYASERPYGHRLTPANSTCALVQGQKQCKQLWITALDLSKLAKGVDDPSQPGFWVPAQDITAQYVSPQWTLSVIDAPK